jgi:nucleoside-triphosphate--adenylate kinase
MSEDFGFSVVSTGDALREAIRQNKPEGAVAQSIIKSGGLVPDDIMTKMLRSLLVEHSAKSWILDGYPRTLSQAKILDSLLTELHLPLDVIFNLNVPVEVILPRVSGRLVHPQVEEKK